MKSDPPVKHYLNEYGVPYSNSYVTLPCKTVHRLVLAQIKAREKVFKEYGIEENIPAEADMRLLEKLLRVSRSPEMADHSMQVTVDDLDVILYAVYLDR